ncbi:MAG: two-component sensor histidine kinase [Chloroflexota bacterium]|nr:MAG: two-component sensor histidine kinase [Chloroflexota bacterium]
MWRSLRFRLLTATLFVVIVAVSLTALFASGTTTREFHRYVLRSNTGQALHFGLLLANAYSQAQTWAGIQPLVEQLGQVSGNRVVLADASGKVVADSDQELVDQAVEADWPEPSSNVVVDGKPIGTLYLNPLAEPSPHDLGFLAAVNHFVLVGAFLAGAIAVLVTLALSHRIVRPIELLTAAARQMEKGDLTGRVNVRSGDEIGQLAAAFNAMADGLARLEQLRRNMVGDVAHELRTPLTNLRGYLEAARDGLVTPGVDLVDNLYEEVMLLNRLVDDLQELALAEAGQLHLECRPVDVGEVARMATEAIRPQAEASGLDLSLDVPPNLPPVVADPHRIGQVLRNLLNNALEFTPHGGQVTLTARLDGTWVCLEVGDSGPGIVQEQLPFVFERFYRTDPSRTRVTGGAGLGLAIVKQLVEAHGGRVWVKSRPGTGSQFGFTLPVT